MIERSVRTQDEFMRLLGNLDYEQFSTAVRSLISLVHQFRSAVGLPEPYFIVPDNNLLQDIRRASEEKRRFPRYVAVEGFAYFLRNYTKFDTRIVITPTIFFESVGMRELKSEYEYREVLYQFGNDLALLGLPVMTSNFKNYKDARRLCSLILRDARLITKMFSDIKKSEWNIPLQNGSNKYPIRIPMREAHEILPRIIKLKYFREWYVRIVLGSVIEKSILQSRANSKVVRKIFLNENRLTTSSLIKIRKDQVKGLGDVELFQYCDIRSQFASKSPVTYIGLTFDKNLAKVLHEFSNLNVRSEEIRGGESESSMMKKWENYQNDLKRLTRFDEVQKVFGNDYGSFLDDLRPVIVGLEDKLMN